MVIRMTLGIALLALVVPVSPVGAGEIHDAVRQGNLARVEALLQADPGLAEAPDDSQFRDLPLHVAAAEGQVEIARLLIEHGAAVDGGDSDESTPLGVAAMRRQKDMVAFLIDRGADVNRRDRHGSYSLSFAASGGDPEIVQMLVAAGADFNYRHDQGLTLLHFAVSRGLTDLANILLARGDDVNAGSENGGAPLDWAFQRENLDMARLLLEHGAAVTAASEGAPTPLFWIAQTGNLDAARLLVEYGADVNATTETGRTPLQAAVKSGGAELVSFLISSGAAVDGTYEGGATLLHIAALRGYGDVAGRLIEAGVAVDATDDRDRTAFQLARRHGHRELAGLLRSHGADATAPDLVTRAASDRVDDGEAVVWYLGHSGWGIRTRNHFLVFDYDGRGRRADEPGLANGTIVPGELAGLQVTAFASHAHGDHYDPSIFSWRDELPDITYVLGFEPEDAADFEYIGPREVREIDGLTIRTIESNDSGVGFLVEADGLTIYHAGDHANRLRDLSGPYRAEIDYLIDQGLRPDITFMPISGCNFGDQEAVRIGVYDTLDSWPPRVFLPMHAGGAPDRYREFISACRKEFPEIQMVVIENDGDSFRYRDGRTS